MCRWNNTKIVRPLSSLIPFLRNFPRDADEKIASKNENLLMLENENIIRVEMQLLLITFYAFIILLRHLVNSCFIRLILFFILTFKRIVYLKKKKTVDTVTFKLEKLIFLLVLNFLASKSGVKGTI